MAAQHQAIASKLLVKEIARLMAMSKFVTP
jgi:hypothetical protein